MTKQREPVADSLRASVAGAIPVLEAFLRHEVCKTGFCRAVLGLSGGIDSAVVAYLAVRALGADNVYPVIMPYKLSSPASLQHAEMVLADLGLRRIVVEITPQIDAYFAGQQDVTPLRKGNKMARERMSILFDYSAQHQGLVLGTSNKTELLLGYGTQFGDTASALNPIGDLYKTQIRELAAVLGVPTPICEKAPSADLWEDQTDEKELGFTYDEADAILHLLTDERLSPEDAAVQSGLPLELVSQIARRVRLNQYKRRMPVIAKLSSRTIGIDFRYPRDWGQ
ncbi:MAG: NAD+ synthase [Firmicutes bacterium]|nr:NAD+ synthase [Bacillota bacterium]